MKKYDEYDMIHFRNYVAPLVSIHLGNGMIVVVVVVFGRFNIFVTDGNENRFPIISVHENFLRMDSGHAMRKRMFSYTRVPDLQEHAVPT